MNEREKRKVTPVGMNEKKVNALAEIRRRRETGAKRELNVQVEKEEANEELEDVRDNFIVDDCIFS